MKIILFYLFSFVLFELSKEQSQQKCEPLNLSQGQVYINETTNSFLLGRNDSQINEFNHLQDDFILLTLKSDIMQYNFTENWITISLVLLEQNLQQKLICRLIYNKLNNEHLIYCIEGIVNQYIYSEPEFSIKGDYKINITFENQQEITCKQMFKDSNNNLIIWCFSLIKIIKIEVNTFTKTIVNKSFDISNDSQIALQKECKTKVLIFQNNYYIIIYYKCQQWQLYFFDEDKFEIIQINTLNSSDLINVGTNNKFIFLYFNSYYQQYDIQNKNFKNFQIPNCDPCNSIFDIYSNQYYLLQYKNEIKVEIKNDHQFLSVFNDTREILLINQQVILSSNNTVSIYYAIQMSKDYNLQLNQLQQFYNFNQFIAINQQTQNIQIFQLQHRFQHYPYMNKTYQYILIYRDWNLMQINGQLIYFCFKVIQTDSSNQASQFQVITENAQSQIDVTLTMQELKSSATQNSSSVNSTIKFSKIEKLDEKFCNIKTIFKFPFFFVKLLTNFYYITNFQKGLIQIVNCDNGKEFEFQVPYDFHFQPSTIGNSLFSILIGFKQTVFIFQLQIDSFKYQKIEFSQNIYSVNSMQYNNNLLISFHNSQSMYLIEDDSSNIYYIEINLNNVHTLNMLYKKKFVNIQSLNLLYLITDKKQYVYDFSNRIILLQNKMQLSKKFFGFISAHNFKNSLILHIQYQQYIINQEIELYQYNLIRPLMYSNFNNFFSIAVEKNNEQFSIIFSIDHALGISLFDIIKIGSLHFANIGNYFIYDNENNEQKIRNLFEQTIRLNDIQSINLTQQIFINFYFLTLNDKPSNSLLGTIFIINKNYQLIKRNKINDTLQINKQDLRNFNIQNLILGNIENIYLKFNKVLENKLNLDYIKLISLQNKCFIYFNLACIIKQSENISQHNLQYELVLFQQHDIEFQIIKLLQFELDYLEIIQFFLFDSKKQNLILVIKQQEERTLLYRVFSIENQKEIIILNNQSTLYDAKIHNIDIEYELEYDENIILFKNDIYLNFYYFNSKIKKLELYFTYLDYNNNYSQFKTLSMTELLIVNSDKQKIKIIISLFPQNLNFTINLQEIIQFNKILQFTAIINLNVIQYVIHQNMIELQIFVSGDFVGFIIKTYYFIQTQSIQIIKVKQLRNPMNIKNLTLSYISQKLLILQDSDNSYFYNIDQDLEFIDSIFKSDNNFTLNQLNSTHYILYNKTTQSTYIALFGYTIPLSFDFNQDIYEIVIQNQVSTISIQINNSREQKDSILILILVFTQISLIAMIYILKRKYNKLQNKSL